MNYVHSSTALVWLGQWSSWSLADISSFLCTLLFGVDLHFWLFCKHLFETYVRSVFFYFDFICYFFNVILFFCLDLVDDVV